MAKERKNPSDARKERTVRERGYFHTGNSGISVSLVEEFENYDWDEQDRNWYNHYLEIRHSAFGAGTSVRTPIAGPAMCDYFIEAFTRLKFHTRDNPDYSVPNPFDRYDPDNENNDIHRITDVQDGVQRRAVWSEEMVASENSTETYLLGYDMVDPKTAEVIRHMPHKGRRIIGGCSGGSEPIYPKDAIGLPLTEAHQMMAALEEKRAAKAEADRLAVLAGIEPKDTANFALVSNLSNITIGTNNGLEKIQEQIDRLSARLNAATGSGEGEINPFRVMVGETIPLTYEQCIDAVAFLYERDRNAVVVYENSEKAVRSSQVDSQSLVPSFIADCMTEPQKVVMSVTVHDETTAEQFSKRFGGPNPFREA